MRAPDMRLLAAALAVAAAWTGAPAVPVENPGIGDAARSAPAEAESGGSIRWRTWSKETFDEAVNEGKPIFLFIATDWTRASQYIDENVFTDPEVIQLANERWIPIRVDRDRRPDLDIRYRLAASAIVEDEVGWPLVAMLSEAGELLYGRSYIPLEDRRSGPGLRSYLSVGAGRYAKNRGSAAEYRPFVSRAFGVEDRVRRPAEVRADLIDEMAAGLLGSLDRVYGGFGEAPHLVHPYAIELAVTLYQRREDPALLDAALRTLDAMERGAIHDRVGGGFHRMTTDAAWRRPVFEKLVNYNATILRGYVMAWQATGEERYRITAERTLDWILGTLAPGGSGFRLAQSASAGANDAKGIYYTWTLDQFDAAIPESLRPLAHALFHVSEKGDLLLGDPPRNLLYVVEDRTSIATHLKMDPESVRDGERRILDALAEVRAARPAPPLGSSVYLDSTALVAQVLIEVAGLLGREDARLAALGVLDRLVRSFPEEGGIRHRLDPSPDPQVDGVFAQDHLMLAAALMAAHENTRETRYLDAAVELVRRSRELFWDAETGGYYDIPAGTHGPGYMSFRRRLNDDTGYPALNALGSRVLDRLASLTGDATYRADAEACLKLLITATGPLDHRTAGLGLALDAHLRAPTRYVVVGSQGDRLAEDLTTAARALFDPGKRVVSLRPGEDDAAIAALGVSGGVGTPFVVACADGGCSEPVSRPEGVASIRAPRSTSAVD